MEKPARNPFLRQVPAEPAPARAPKPNVLGAYPQVRLRRNRGDHWCRRLVAENRLAVEDLIWPVFVQEADGSSAVDSMPQVDRYGIAELVDAIGRAAESGIGAVALFPHVEPDARTSDCREATNPDNLICRAVRALKEALPEVGVICDVALDPYNSDGHDGLVQDGRVLNDESVLVLTEQAATLAEAGCDMVAPSDMMDGRIGSIRATLDGSGYEDVRILAYAAKYASAFYGPFREAVGSGTFLSGDKKTYQMDPANSDEALREVALDLDEGADMIMVKPGLPYLDIIHRIKSTYAVPTLAYQVSGEYAMLKAAAKNGWLDNDKVLLESLLAFKRAGADAVFTYAAPEVAKLLKN